MRPNHLVSVALVACLVGPALSTAEAKGTATITFTTTPAPGGTYSPNNVVAAWIETGAGTHVKTLGRWSAVRTQYLLAYIGKAGANEALTTDAVSGASRISHTDPLTIVWNLRDRAGNLVPDGTYRIRLELADSNATTTASNNEGTFTFVKGTAPQTQTALTNGGFTNVTIAFNPDGVFCGDAIVDAPEKCDPALAGSCPSDTEPCAFATDGCMPNVIVGVAADCSAECVVQPVTTCANNDRCCLTGEGGVDCSATDNDCTGAGSGSGSGSGTGLTASSDGDIVGGCAVGSDSPPWLFALLGLALLVIRRQRR